MPTEFEMVKEFHAAYGMPIGESPALNLSPEREELRFELIKEEWNEFNESYEEGDLENTAKEMADVLYVIYGMAVELGIPLDKVFEEVHRSNMSKLSADGTPIYREDGKVLKGPNYRPANIGMVLDED